MRKRQKLPSLPSPGLHRKEGGIKKTRGKLQLRRKKKGNPEIGGVPTTPDPNTSAKASRYKWEAYRDTNWWCI